MRVPFHDPARGARLIWNLPAGRPAEILLVEDNEDDVLLTRMGIQRSGLPANVHAVGNGAECLKFLRRQPPWSDSRTPDLVLLDLNMPVLDGRSTLAAMAADEALRHIPVVVLTTSARESDIRDAYRLHCSGYVVKPVDLDRFHEALHELLVYWFRTVHMPSRPARR